MTGVYTNVKDVDITSYIPEDDADLLASGYPTVVNDPSVFAVLNNKSYIVGAVVIGENAGPNANYAYIIGKAKSEERIDDTYYWEFDAAVNGEFKTLTVKTKYISVIEGIKAVLNASGSGSKQTYANGYLYCLTYDPDGYVTNVTPVDEIVSAVNNFGADTAAGWNQSIKDASARVMNVTTAGGAVIRNIAGVLYNMYWKVDGGGVGLPLAEDCTFAVIQKEGSTTAKYGNLADFDAAWGLLADYKDDNVSGDKYFRGTISAVLNSSGQAPPSWCLTARRASRPTSIWTPATASPIRISFCPSTLSSKT